MDVPAQPADVVEPTEVADRVDAVRDALREVVDPELGIDFVELGLVYAISVDGDTAHVSFTLTTPGCPIVDVAAAWIERAATTVPGVEACEAELVWTPIWDAHMMSDDAKFAFGY